MFLKEVTYAHQGYIYLIKNTVCTTVAERAQRAANR